MNTSPKWRSDAAKAVELLMTYLNTTDTMLTTCITCARFNEQTERCGLYDARPPARVIAFGCEQYTDGRDDPDDIPY